MRPDPYHIFAQGGEDAELKANTSIAQTFIQAQDDEKDAKLWKILQDFPDSARVVIFANTKRRVDYLQKALWDEGLGTCSIHGDKQQTERDQALKMFIAGERPLMIATDVAARGLDIKGVTHVINFDMARDVESYIHRIGRTGRAGELGASITFWNPDYDKECTPVGGCGWWVRKRRERRAWRAGKEDKRQDVRECLREVYHRSCPRVRVCVCVALCLWVSTGAHQDRARCKAGGARLAG